MKAEPLKGKLKYLGTGKSIDDEIFKTRDICSAVEWLKKECQNYQNYGEKSWLFKKINEAFKDVME